MKEKQKATKSDENGERKKSKVKRRKSKPKRK